MCLRYGASACAYKNGILFESANGSGVAAIGKTEVSVGSTEGKPGDTAELELTVNSTAPIDTLLVEFTFEEQVSFVGFDGAVNAFELSSA